MMSSQQGSGMDAVTSEQLLAQLAAYQAGLPGGDNEALTQVLLEKLQEEVSRTYGSSESNDAANGPPSPAKSYSSNILGSTRGTNRPRPVDLWKASHEVDRAPKEKVILDENSWDDLVSRLNEGSKKKEMLLLKAQHKQMADQLAGYTFTPQISEKSRELASLNKALPERVALLMRKKAAKLEKIRHEKVQREMSEATFKPNINKPKNDGVVRKVGHLMQYEYDRRLRSDQRRALVKEMEDRELSFAPKINKNSERIVQRLQREATEGEGKGYQSLTTNRLHRQALIDATLSGRLPGRNALPGHEQETFRPIINERSKLLFRPGEHDVDVYTRLYSANSPRADRKESDESKKDKITPSHPAYFHNIAYDQKGKHDFIVALLNSNV